MSVYQIDTMHSSAEFSVKHMMISTVKGVFEDLQGRLDFDAENPEDSKIVASISTASVNTRVEDRDNHLRSADFFDAENYPKMKFESTDIEVSGENTGKVTGDLTIRDTTKQVVFDVEYLGEMENSPFGDTRAGFVGSTTIDREDWNLTWNQALEAGGVLVSKEVKISIDVQAVKQEVGEKV